MHFDEISTDLFLRTVNYHLVALNSFIIGTLIIYCSSSKEIMILLNNSISDKLFFTSLKFKYLIHIAHLCMIVVVATFFFSYGTDAFYRQEYLVDGNRALIAVFKILSLITVIVLAFTQSTHKYISYFYLLVILTIALSSGSRFGFFYLILFFLLKYQTSRNNIYDKIKFFCGGIFSFFFLSYLMTLRGLPTHGLIPYITSVFEDSSSTNGSVLFNVYYTFIFGIFASAQTMIHGTTDVADILISINPLPGKLAGWYKIAESRRLNPWTPMSSNGEIFNMGMLFTTFMFTIIGMILCYFEIWMRKFFREKLRLVGFAIALLSLLFTAISFEYNLRSTLRYLYYIGVIILIASYLRYLRFRIGNTVYLKKAKKH